MPLITSSGKIINNVFVMNLAAKAPVPGYGLGRLNASYTTMAVNYFKNAGCEVKTTFIDDLNMDKIDVAKEHEKHRWSDLIYYQTPLYWFSTPWQMKRYMDQVYTEGMGGQLCTSDGRTAEAPEDNYASGGTLAGEYMLSVTTNAPFGAFNRPDVPQAGPLKDKTLDDLFIWFHANQRFFNLRQIPDSTFHAADVIKNPKHEEDFKRWKQHMDRLFK